MDTVEPQTIKVTLFEGIFRRKPWPSMVNLGSSSNGGTPRMVGLFHGKSSENLEILNLYYKMIERSLEVKLPTIWTHEAAEVGRDVQEKESEGRRSKCRKR